MADQDFYVYAQLDDDGVCVAVSQLCGPVEADNMIPLDESALHDAPELFGRPHVDGVWGEKPKDD